MKKTKIRTLALLLFILLSIFVLIIPDNINNCFILGMVLCVSSVFSIYLYKKSNTLIFLIAIISIINIALCFSNFFFYEKYNYYWQQTLINTNGQYVMGKVCVLFYLSFIIGIELVRKKTIKKMDNDINPNKIINKFNGNKPIYWVGMVFLYIILIFGFDRSPSKSGYVVASNPLYEYAILTFLFVWIYAPKKNFYKYCLLLYACMYILQGIVFGDRSSAFPMILLCFILIKKRKVKAGQLSALSALGIFGANIVGIFRMGNYGGNIILEAFERLFYVDSLSYSYYTGIQIIRAAAIIPSKIETFFRWMISIFLGGTSNSAISKYIMDYSKSMFFNRGGGMTCSYFYFWFGWIGVVVGGLVMGMIISHYFSKTNIYGKIIQLLLIVFSMRWYVYSPNVFFRTCIFIPFVLFLVVKYTDKLFKSKTGVKHFDMIE